MKRIFTFSEIEDRDLADTIEYEEPLSAEVGLRGRTPPPETWDANPSPSEAAIASMLAGAYGEELMVDVDTIRRGIGIGFTSDEIAGFEELRSY